MKRTLSCAVFFLFSLGLLIPRCVALEDIKLHAHSMAARPEVPASISYPRTSSTGQYLVRWVASINATQYRLERSADSGATWQLQYTGTALSYSETVGYGRYRYRVSALNAAGSSSWRTSGQDCEVVLPIPPVPSSISYPKTSSTGQYTVSWAASPGATEYRVWRTSDGGATWPLQYIGSALSYKETVDYGSYRYRVRAVNATGNCDWLTGDHYCVVMQASADPLSLLGSSLLVWLDGQDMNSMTIESGRVAQWNDKSGRGNHVTATGAARPTFRTDGINLKPSLEFAGQEQFMQKRSPSGLPTGNSSYTMIVLYQFDNALGGTMHGSARYLASFGGEGGQPPPPSGTMAAIDLQPPQRFVHWGLDVTMPNAPRFLDGEPHYYIDAYNAATREHSLYFGGESPRSVTLGSNLALVNDFFMINRFSNSVAQGVKARIGEVLLINGVLDTATRQKVEAYLDAKWWGKAR